MSEDLRVVEVVHVAALEVDPGERQVAHDAWQVTIGPGVVVAPARAAEEPPARPVANAGENELAIVGTVVEGFILNLPPSLTRHDQRKSDDRQQ